MVLHTLTLVSVVFYIGQDREKGTQKVAQDNRTYVVLVIHFLPFKIFSLQIHCILVCPQRVKTHIKKILFKDINHSKKVFYFIFLDTKLFFVKVKWFNF
jgi:hypothetical protein